MSAWGAKHKHFEKYLCYDWHMNNKFVLAITGPTGSGKSTVALKLAKQFEKCVDIEIDHIKHFIVTAFSYEIKVDGVKKWDYNEWELVGDSVGLLAHNFRAKGYNVIINGYMNESAWKAVQKHIALTHKILLLPEQDETMKRDRQRPGDEPMGEQAVKDHRDFFSNSSFFNDFTTIDTTNHPIGQTVSEIAEQLK